MTPPSSVILEWVKLVGSLAGLLATAFIVSDRLVGQRPILNLLDYNVRRGAATVQIVNPGKRTIFLSSASVLPKALGIMASRRDDWNDILGSEEFAFEYVSVAPGEKARIELLPMPMMLKGPVLIVVHWRRDWWPAIPIFRLTTGEHLRRLPTEM